MREMQNESSQIEVKEKNDKSGTSDKELLKLNWLFCMFTSLFIIERSLNSLSAYLHIAEDLKYIPSKNNQK